jgi:uncharacterized protein YbaP (TraB family)
MTKLKPLFSTAALGLAAAGCLAASGPAAAEPALWVIKDKDSTLYLFGTMHLAREDVVTTSKTVSKALAASQEMWVEVDLPEDPTAIQAQIQPLILQLGVDPARPLSSKLTADENKRLKAAAAKLGVPMAMLDPMKPWLASMTLQAMQYQAAGYDPNKGAESVLSKVARARKTRISSFETVEQQMRFLAGMNPQQELQSFRETLDQLEEGPQMVKALEAKWASGDAEGLWKLAGEEFKREQPAGYDVLITQRNKAWADRIEAELKGKGTDFVAVGALHLVGPDSVQALLAKKGIKATRVNPARAKR